MGLDVVLSLGERGADATRLDLLHRQLRDELRQADGLDVASGPSGSSGSSGSAGSGQPGAAAPPGTRGIDPATMSTLAVAVLGSGGLTAVVASARAWLGREHVTRTVRVEVSGDVLELSGASTAEQNRLVEIFLARHEGGGRP